MKIALVQKNFFIGDLEGNAAKIIDGHKKAGQAGADWAVLSELAATGYMPKDLL